MKSMVQQDEISDLTEFMEQIKCDIKLCIRKADLVSNMDIF